ncbi:helix-turn-helix transcriptional regulator [Celeribacter baekdonensis]|uniref:helix-turn-helix transcriptional regulator n=1 Tax=Celeribacter baekdonensis TaxID=875171 RepID=UPI003A8F4D76
MLEDALVLNARGELIRHDRPIHSQDWDEVQDFCRTVYMPYRVQPRERLSKPNATMISAQTGQTTLTRFSYGTGIHLDRFDPDAGNILVLNTICGALNHHCDTHPASTTAGESFVVDCSRTDYWLDANAEHMQLNLTIPHHLMESTAERWFGFVPDDALWTRRVKFGGPGSRWLSLLDYASRTLSADIPLPATGPLGRHLEETLCLELLMQWAKGAGLSLAHGARTAAPRYVRQAEEVLTAQARDAPTIGDVAHQVGVSARTLSEGFRRFRGVTPRAFLAARRLEGLRADLESAGPERTVADIANAWGYVNLGALAGVYRDQFGELPSHTRMRARRAH